MTPRTALIVVDVQRGFVEAVGADAPRVLHEVNLLVDAAVEARHPVFYTRDVAPFAVPEGDPDGLTELHPDLDVIGTVVEKGPGRRGSMSGFLLAGGSAPGRGGIGPLAAALQRTGVAAVTVAGIAADVCVAATARDAVRLGYAATIPLAATAFVHAHPEGDDAAVAELRAAGVTVAGDRARVG
jgi:nicotinamidase/pyrazinamidase